jgi:ATP-dependent RNA helicase RhlE
LEFRDSGLHEALLRGVAEMGFTTPTPIQAQTIPAGLAGRDLLAAAMTGSGKTAAFLLPILHRLMGKPAGTIRALVLTPTRELAAQIHEHLQGLAKHTRLRSATVFGGVAAGPQEAAFRNGVDVLIATPGRLLEHLAQPYARLDQLDVLVLDEADRMLDMGFLPDVRRVLARLPKQRQTLFFSATLPPEIQKLAGEMLHNPYAVNVERKAAPAKGITQRLYPVPQTAKVDLLVELLRRGDIGNVIVFARTKHRTNRLSEQLEKRGIPNGRMHGNRSQAQRTEALASFKDGRLRVLCATDIVARGIDVEQLQHVVNFDVPHMPEDYIHRVGRTARADAVGEAFTFVSPEEESDVSAIERAIGARIPRVKLDGFDYERKPAEALEIPIHERIAKIRAEKAEARERQRQKAERAASQGGQGGPPRRDGGGRGGPPRGEPRRDGGGRGGPPRDAPRRADGPEVARRPPLRDGPRREPRRDEAPRSTWADLPGPGARPRDPDAVEVAPGIWRGGGGRR